MKNISIDFIYDDGKPAQEKMITADGVTVAWDKRPTCFMQIKETGGEFYRWISIDYSRREEHQKFLEDSISTWTSRSNWWWETTWYDMPTCKLEGLAAYETKEVEVPYTKNHLYGYDEDRGCFVMQVYGETESGGKFHEVWTNKGKAQHGCFVTTAAYGDPMHPMVCTFRSLRDEILVNFKIGRRFIDWYNQNGPELAHIVDQREACKVVSRVVLTPVASAVSTARKLIDKNPRLKSYFNELRSG